MKILIIDENVNRIGGVERIICTLANKLSEKHDVTVISEYGLLGEPFYKYNSQVKLEYLMNDLMSRNKSIDVKNIKYYSYRVVEKIKAFLFLRRKFKKTLRIYNDADVIIFGRVFVALDFLPILKKINKTKIIVRDAIHLKYFSKKVKNKMLKYFPKIVDQFIVSSDESMNEYQKFFGTNLVNMKKIYNPLGIVPKQSYNTESKTIISVGRMDSQKGYDALIKAFALVYKDHPDWQLKLYGNGNYEKYLRRLVDTLDLSSSVEILPPIKDVVKVFNSAAIFALPSRYEGYANVLVEAMSCGMPCVSYNWLMGVEEIIKDGENGFVVPLQNRDDYFKGIYSNQDINNLAQKINYMIENPKVCKKISKESMKIANSRELTNIINEWLELID